MVDGECSSSDFILDLAVCDEPGDWSEQIPGFVEDGANLKII
jgi:hypothetical protein